MTKTERQRVAELKRLIRAEDKVHVKLSRRWAKLAKATKAVRDEMNAHMRRWRKLQNEVEKIRRDNRPVGLVTTLLDKVKELMAADPSLSMTEAVAKAKGAAKAVPPLPA